MAERTTGGNLLARLLAAEGVDAMFGIVDSTYFGVTSSLDEFGIRLWSPRHEAAALHMAGSWSRSTGRLGVAIASNGPGVANALPGVAVEQAEGNRVLLLTSSRRPGVGGPDRGGASQYFDQVAVTRPMVKWAQRVPRAERLPELVRQALRVSWSGRPGVVHLDIPESVLNGTMRVEASDLWAAGTARRTHPLRPDPDQVQQAARLLTLSELPLIHAGSGVLHAGAEQALARLAGLLDAAVTTSWAARGVLPEDNPRMIPMIHPTIVDDVRNDADAVLVVGSRLGETDWWGQPPNWAPGSEQQLVQVDVDEDNLGRHRPATVAMLADARLALEALADAVEARGTTDTSARRHRLTDYQTAIRRDRERLAQALEREDDAPVHPAKVPAAAQDAFPTDTCWVFDGGNTSLWAHFYHRALVPGTIHATPRFGMLGAGMGQALGLAIANPDRHVCAILGDGAFGMHPTEVETAVRHGLAITFIVMVDGAWGTVRGGQERTANPVRTLARRVLRGDAVDVAEVEGATFADVRYDDMAEAMGAVGFHVDHASDLDAVLASAAAVTHGPSVVHVDVDDVEHLWPPELRTVVPPADEI